MRRRHIYVDTAQTIWRDNHMSKRKAAKQRFCEWGTEALQRVCKVTWYVGDDRMVRLAEAIGILHEKGLKGEKLCY